VLRTLVKNVSELHCEQRRVCTPVEGQPRAPGSRFCTLRGARFKRCLLDQVFPQFPGGLIAPQMAWWGW
jgi:hypothetical protein